MPTQQGIACILHLGIRAADQVDQPHRLKRALGGVLIQPDLELLLEAKLEQRTDHRFALRKQIEAFAAPGLDFGPRNIVVRDLGEVLYAHRPVSLLSRFGFDEFGIEAGRTIRPARCGGGGFAEAL